MTTNGSYRLARVICAALAICLGAPAFVGPSEAARKSQFRVCWATFAGYMPWGYAKETGIMEKWAKKYGISVDLVHFPEYVYSITAFANGEYDACMMTNVDALVSPAGAGFDTTAIIPLDYSNGADAIIMKGGEGVKDLAGQPVFLVQYSVSHYLLSRALVSAGLSEADVVIIDTSDKEIVAKFANEQVSNVVSWNPLLPELLKQPGAKNVFDTASLPGEVIDVLAVNTATLKDNPELGKALTGAWFEVSALIAQQDDRGMAARETMAAASGADVARLFSSPGDAVEFLESDALPGVTDAVRNFLFSHQLLGPEMTSVDSVGISFPSGKVLGAEQNIRLRFDSQFARMAREGKL